MLYKDDMIADMYMERDLKDCLKELLKIKQRNKDQVVQESSTFKRALFNYICISRLYNKSWN